LSEYVATGGIQIGGCAGYKLTKFVVFPFGPGAIVYLRFKAVQGILEKVAIKKIDIHQNRRTYNQIVPIYVDNNNRLYNESDLCGETEAIQLAITYYNNRLAAINDLLTKC
jgi:hypothetical protein